MQELGGRDCRLESVTEFARTDFNFKATGLVSVTKSPFIQIFLHRRSQYSPAFLRVLPDTRDNIQLDFVPFQAKFEGFGQLPQGVFTRISVQIDTSSCGHRSRFVAS